MMAEVKDLEPNLKKAFDYHYQEEKYPAKYRIIMLNLERVQNQLKNNGSTVVQD
jgi:hypothetical protein